MLPRRRPSREIITAIQYNLGEFDKLSIEELKILRDTVVRVVNTHISELKGKP